MLTIADFSATGHPDASRLRAFSEGLLPNAELEHIGFHLASCNTCLALLDGQNSWGRMRGALEQPQHAAASLESSASALLDDTAVERIKAEPDFQRMAVQVKALVVSSPCVTPAWPFQPIEGEPLPEKIGRYFVLRQLGQGGFATVYLAKDPEHNRFVAVKVPRPDKLVSETAVAVFLREARTAAMLDHGHIVPVYDFDRLPDGSCFVVMQYIEGRSLRVAMDEETFSHSESVRLCAAIADALHFAHRKGLVHRDVKPSNILLGFSGKPLLADFGLASTEEQQLRERRAIVGTARYMCPELARGDCKYVDPRSDIYSLGLVLYELLTGRMPYIGYTAQQWIDQALHHEALPPRIVDGSISPELERICLKCLAKSVYDRPTTAGDLAAELRRAIEPETVPEPSSRPATVSRRRFVLVWAAGGVLLAVAAAVLVSLTWPPGEPPRGVWQQLLNKRPTRIHSLTPAGGSEDWDYNTESRKVHVSSTQRHLLKLGDTNRPNYSLSVTIKQAPWRGGQIGLFLGFHETPHSEAQGPPKIIQYETVTVEWNSELSSKPLTVDYSLHVDLPDWRKPFGHTRAFIDVSEIKDLNPGSLMVVVAVTDRRVTSIKVFEAQGEKRMLLDFVPRAVTSVPTPHGPAIPEAVGDFGLFLDATGDGVSGDYSAFEVRYD